MAHYSIISSNRAAIVKSLRDNDLGLVCHLPHLRFDRRSHGKHPGRPPLRKCAVPWRWRPSWGAKKIVLHPSMARGMGAFVLDTVHAYALDFLSEMVGLAETLDLTLCLEKHVSLLRNRGGTGRFRKMAGMVFPALMLTLDSGHANIDDRRGKRLKGFFDHFGRRIGHFSSQ